MKKFKITLLAALMIGIFSVQAEKKAIVTAEKDNETELILDTSTEYEVKKVATKVPQGLKDAVLKQLSMRAHHLYKEGQVYLRLTVDENCNIHIVEMNATSPSLGDYVKKQLASTYVKNPGCKAGQVYIMKVDFNIPK